MPGYNLNDESNNNPICTFEFQLNDKTLMEKRYYSHLVDVLGDVGGFMEIINTFFGLICSFFGGIIYERTIVNSLFLFDTNIKIISLRKKDEKKNILKTTGSENNEKININNEILFMDNINNLNNKGTKDTNNIINENYLKNKKNKFSRVIRIDKMNNNDIYSSKTGSIDKSKNIFESVLNFNKNNKNIDNNDSLNYLLIPICKCCKGKKNNVNIILFNKSMDIITEKLDIFNIFRNMYSIEKNNNNFQYDIIDKQMSEK